MESRAFKTLLTMLETAPDRPSGFDRDGRFVSIEYGLLDGMSAVVTFLEQKNLRKIPQALSFYKEGQPYPRDGVGHWNIPFTAFSWLQGRAMQKRVYADAKAIVAKKRKWVPEPEEIVSRLITTMGGEPAAFRSNYRVNTTFRQAVNRGILNLPKQAPCSPPPSSP